MIVCNRHYQKGRYPAACYYIGRPGRIARQEVARGAIDATLLGNPYTLREHGGKAIRLYKQWMWEQLRPLCGPVFELLASFPASSYLVCSCAPGPCHGDVLVSAWRWIDDLRDQGDAS